jgi:hypothetical protein
MTFLDCVQFVGTNRPSVRFVFQVQAPSAVRFGKIASFLQKQRESGTDSPSITYSDGINELELAKPFGTTDP